MWVSLWAVRGGPSGRAHSLPRVGAAELMSLVP